MNEQQVSFTVEIRMDDNHGDTIEVTAFNAQPGDATRIAAFARKLRAVYYEQVPLVELKGAGE